MIMADQSAAGAVLRYLALFIFLIMAFSDFVDGYIARTCNEVTKLGTFLDPLADKLLMTCSCILLARQATAVNSFLLPVPVVVLIIGKDILILLGFIVIYMMTHTVHIVPVFAGKLSTFLQLTMVAAILIAPEMTKIVPVWAYLLPILWWSAGLVAILATFVYIRAGTRYIEQFQTKLKVKGSSNDCI